MKHTVWESVILVEGDAGKVGREPRVTGRAGPAAGSSVGRLVERLSPGTGFPGSLMKDLARPTLAELQARVTLDGVLVDVFGAGLESLPEEVGELVGLLNIYSNPKLLSLPAGLGRLDLAWPSWTCEAAAAWSWSKRSSSRCRSAGAR